MIVRAIINFSKDEHHMAIAILNPRYNNLRGAIGGLVVKHYWDKVVLTRKPVFRNRIFSTEQKACHERFRQAVLYAKRLMEDPRARAVYEEEARVTGKPARSLIIRDFLKAYSVSIETVSILASQPFGDGGDLKNKSIPTSESGFGHFHQGFHIVSMEKGSDLKKQRRKGPGIAEVPVALRLRQLPIRGPVIPEKVWNPARVFDRRCSRWVQLTFHRRREKFSLCDHPCVWETDFGVHYLERDGMRSILPQEARSD